MIKFHGIAALILTGAHALFFLRGLGMRRRGTGPKVLDRVARALSHGFLPLAVITGFGALRGDRAPGGEFSLTLHLILGILPLVSIVLFSFFRPLKQRVSWLLPGLNALLFLAATLSGFLRGTSL